MEVKLGKFVVKLQKPTSFMAAREVTIAVGTSALRGLGAALGVCWSGKPLKATLAGCKYDTLAYGGAVVDELVAQAATLVFWGGGINQRVSTLERTVAPLADGTLARLDERTEAMQKQLDRIERAR